MIKICRTETLSRAKTKKLAPEIMEFCKKTLRNKPSLILNFALFIVILSGCSFADIRNILATSTPEASATPEPTATRTVFVPQFSDTETPTPVVVINFDGTLRPTWTPNPPTQRPTWTPIPTKTLRPTWTPSITPTPTITPEIGLILSEDFSDPFDPYWIQRAGDNWGTWIFNGVYVMHVKAPFVEISSGPTWLKIDEVALEADVTRKQGHGYFGFACREVGTSYYTAFISTKGYYGFGETRGGDVTFLSYVPTPLIDTAKNATNHVRVECRGNTLTLYINGKWAAEQKVEGIGPGYVAMLTGTTWDQNQVVVHFDNLRIYTPSSIFDPVPTVTGTPPTATITNTPTVTRTPSATP